MEDNVEDVKLGENPIEHPKKYIIVWRNKWITSKAGSIDDFIKVYKNLGEMMQRWKDKGIILDPDIIGGAGDDYAQFCTYDETVALQEGFERFKVEAFEAWDDESEDGVQNFEVNEFISLKLIQGEIIIFVDGERFNQCRYVLLVDPLKNEQQGEIGSIDEAQAIYNNDLESEVTPEELGITKEQEFWAHSSNLQTWAENGYNSRLLHRNLAFPLLKKLTEVGDVNAKKVFKEEIGKRFVSGFFPVMAYLFKEGYLDVLTSEEFSSLLDEINYSKLDLNKLLINITNFLFCEYSLKFFTRIKAEFKDFFSKNPTYIDYAEFVLDKSEFCPVVITPDNRFFIRGSDDGKLKEFDIFTGDLKRLLGDHKMPVFALAISHDGAYIASSCDSKIKVWDYVSGDLIYNLEGHQEAVNCLQFDPQGGYLVSGSVDLEIKVWSIENGTLKRTLGSHWGEISSIDHSSNGNYLVSTAFDGTINLWDTTSSQLITTLIDSDENILKAAISYDETFIVSSSISTITIWELKTKKKVRTIRIQDKMYELRSFVLTPGSKFIVGGLQGPLKEGGRLSMWRVSDGKLIHTIPIKQGFRGYFQELKNMAISQNGVFIVGAARDRTVRLWVDFLTYIEAEQAFRKSKE